MRTRFRRTADTSLWPAGLAFRLMEQPARPRRENGPAEAAETDPRSPAAGPALRDAAEILARAVADEAAADTARERLRGEPQPAIEPDVRVAARLRDGEQVLAVRRSAFFERRYSGRTEHVDRDGRATGLAGDLYVTSQRLMLLGRHTVCVELDDLADIVLVGERLLLVLCDGQGASLEVEQPRLLRVEVAAARARRSR